MTAYEVICKLQEIRDRIAENEKTNEALETESDRLAGYLRSYFEANPASIIVVGRQAFGAFFRMKDPDGRPLDKPKLSEIWEGPIERGELLILAGSDPEPEARPEAGSDHFGEAPALHLVEELCELDDRIQRHEDKAGKWPVLPPDDFDAGEIDPEGETAEAIELPDDDVA